MRRAAKTRGRRAKERGAFVRRSPFIISYWQGRQLCFENYLTRKKIAASIETAMLLDFFSDWKREAAMLWRWPEYTSGSLHNAVKRLVQESFLQTSPSGTPRATPEKKL